MVSNVSPIFGNMMPGVVPVIPQTSLLPFRLGALHYKEVLMTIDLSYQRVVEYGRTSEPDRRLAEQIAPAARDARDALAALQRGELAGRQLAERATAILEPVKYATPAIRSLTFIDKEEAYRERCHPIGLDPRVAVSWGWAANAFIRGAFDAAELRVAAYGHELWRETRAIVEGEQERAFDGKPLREARWKAVGTTDPNVLAHIPEQFKRAGESGEIEHDIANLPYERLSPKWQKENADNAWAVRELMELALARGEEPQEVYELSLNEVAGCFVHSRWLLRNDWAREGELGAPFAELPAVEQLRDLAPVEFSVRAFNEETQKLGLLIAIKAV